MSVERIKLIEGKLEFYEELFEKMARKILTYEKALTEFDSVLTTMKYIIESSNLENNKENFQALKDYLERIGAEEAQEVQISRDITYN